MRFVIGVFLASLLGGCATELMSEKECLAGDWFSAGFEDGQAGLLESAFGERAAICEAYGAPADYETYRQGRAGALSRLCNGRGGYDFARAGRSYLGVCAPEREEEFLAGYLDGWRIRRAEDARARVQSEYETAISRVDAYRESMRRAKRVLRDDDATEKQIARARDNLHEARENLPYAERQAEAMAYELGRADEAFEQVVASSRAWRESREFSVMLNTLMEAHELARANPGIDYCTDESDGFYPRCEIAPGARLADRRSGALCAMGPGEARFVSRDALGAGGVVHAYDFYAADPQTGRADRSPSGFFDALFSEAGEFEGISCGGGQ